MSAVLVERALQLAQMGLMWLAESRCADVLPLHQPHVAFCGLLWNNGC